MIASHYADPLVRHLIVAAPFRTEPSDDADAIGQLGPGDEIRTLDMTRGWAWGYGPDGRVGYVRADSVGI